MNKIPTTPRVNYGLPVPRCFNLPPNRFKIDLFVRSDTADYRIDLYESEGVYWYCLHYPLVQINSRGFVGLRNCVSSMKDTISSLGFRLSNPPRLRKFVDSYEHGLKHRKAVA